MQPRDIDQYHNQLSCKIVHRAYSPIDQYVMSGCDSSHQERSRCTYEGVGVGTSCS